MRESLPQVCGEHVHTRRRHTRINHSVFKKSNVMCFQLKKKKKKKKKEKPENRKKKIPRQN